MDQLPIELCLIISKFLVYDDLKSLLATNRNFVKILKNIQYVYDYFHFNKKSIVWWKNYFPLVKYVRLTREEQINNNLMKYMNNVTTLDIAWMPIKYSFKSYALRISQEQRINIYRRKIKKYIKCIQKNMKSVKRIIVNNKQYSYFINSKTMVVLSNNKPTIFPNNSIMNIWA